MGRELAQALFAVVGTISLKRNFSHGVVHEKRDLKALACEVGEWNELIAGFVGKFKDIVGDNFVAPITGFGDFEHLEAKGRDKHEFLR